MCVERLLHLNNQRLYFGSRLHEEATAGRSYTHAQIQIQIQTEREIHIRMRDTVNSSNKVIRSDKTDIINK